MGKCSGQPFIFLRPVFCSYYIQAKVLGSKSYYMCVLEILKSKQLPSRMLQTPSKKMWYSPDGREAQPITSRPALFRFSHFGH